MRLSLSRWIVITSVTIVCLGSPWCHSRMSPLPPNEFDMFVAVGYAQMNKFRERKYQRAKSRGYHLISYVSPKATFWAEYSSIGDNCFIMENNVIQPFVEIGNDVLMWSGNQVGHNSVIKDHCFVASQVVVAGNVTVEANCFLGVNSTIRDGVTVARECVIGAGAVILQNTEERQVYVGQKASSYRYRATGSCASSDRAASGLKGGLRTLTGRRLSVRSATATAQMSSEDGDGPAGRLGKVLPRAPLGSLTPGLTCRTRQSRRRHSPSRWRRQAPSEDVAASTWAVGLATCRRASLASGQVRSSASTSSPRRSPRAANGSPRSGGSAVASRTRRSSGLWGTST